MTRVISFVAAAFLIFGATASAETVGFSQVGTESDWRTAFSADMQAEAKLRGIDLKFDDAQQSIERQIAAIRRFIAQRVDAIVIAPVVVTGWTPVLQEAQAAHIPVFIADRAVDADPSLFVARIAADFNLEGVWPRPGWLRHPAGVVPSSKCKVPPAPRQRSSGRRVLRRSSPSFPACGSFARRAATSPTTVAGG